MVNSSWNCKTIFFSGRLCSIHFLLCLFLQYKYCTAVFFSLVLFGITKSLFKFFYCSFPVRFIFAAVFSLCFIHILKQFSFLSNIFVFRFCIAVLNSHIWYILVKNFPFLYYSKTTFCVILYSSTLHDLLLCSSLQKQ